MADWKDPVHVWNFQRRFGVNKVKVEIADGEKRPFAAVAEDETRMRIRAPTAEEISSSGQSSASDTAEDNCGDSNVVYYAIDSAFWYYVFLLGTQLGDETYYSIFFSFWFWNIDGAVGRRVILVWNVIMYIGEKDRGMQQLF